MLNNYLSFLVENVFLIWNGHPSFPSQDEALKKIKIISTFIAQPLVSICGYFVHLVSMFQPLLSIPIEADHPSSSSSQWFQQSVSFTLIQMQHLLLLAGTHQLITIFLSHSSTLFSSSRVDSSKACSLCIIFSVDSTLIAFKQKLKFSRNIFYFSPSSWWFFLLSLFCLCLNDFSGLFASFLKHFKFF